MNDAFLQHQRSWLCPQATGEWDSGPRPHAEQEHPYRTCFQRDRDRVIHCSAFRRLDYKTQVFVPHEQDHFRTRLTHTLEVAQVARTLARALRANEDLTEAVALAHDLGHPPFGHAGESALAEQMAEHGHFEHNRQSLRIVDYLEHPYPAFRGLNLTAAVRECLARHSTRYDTPRASRRRWKARSSMPPTRSPTPRPTWTTPWPCAGSRWRTCRS
jgi:dGTPase